MKVPTMLRRLLGLPPDGRERAHEAEELQRRLQDATTRISAASRDEALQREMDQILWRGGGR